MIEHYMFRKIDPHFDNSIQWSKCTIKLTIKGNMMRELAREEIEQVAGGFEGTKIPFSNGFLPGQNMGRVPSNAVIAAAFAYGVGTQIGDAINRFNQNQFGMSLGVAIHRTVNGGSNIGSGAGGGGGKLTPIITIEEI
jgi:hypothetical protein